MALMLLVGTSSAWAADLYIKGNPDAKIWIWTSSENYTGGEWNNRPQLQNTDYFTKIEANIYKYTKSNKTLPDKISIKINDQADIKDVDNISTKYIDADANEAKDKEGLDLECSIVNSESILIEVESSINPYIWAWQDDASETKLVQNTNWPGDKLNGNSNVYSVEYKPTTPTISIIFTNNSSYQTPDIKNLKVGKRYRFSYNGSNSNLYEIKQIECLASLCIDSDDVNPGTVNVKPANDKYCAGENYKLSINPTAIGGYTTTIQWQKKDGNNYSNVGSNSTLLNLENLVAGTYTYRATVTWTKGTCTVTESTADKSFTVNALPDAPTNLGSATICNGETATLPEVTGSWYADANTTTPLASISIEVNPAETTSYFATSKSNNCESSSRTEYVVKVKSLASANNYELTKTTAVYTGTAVTLQTSDVNVTNNAGTVSTIYFKQNGNTVNPINVGEYDVYVTTVATDDICAGDIKIGTFTITQATQAELFISNEQVKFCGLPAQYIDLTTEGGTTAGEVTFTSDNESVATIENNNQLRVIKEGSVNITATMAENDNYKSVTSKAKQFTFYKAPEKPTASQVVNIKLCKGEPTNGKIVINHVGPAYEYTIDPTATGNAKDGFVISNAGDYVVTVTRTVDGCTMQTNSDPITVGTDDNTPTITDVTISGDAEVCINTGTTLTASVTAENYDDIAYSWSNDATAQSIQTGDLAEDKTFTVTVTATKNGTCPVTYVKNFNIQVKPISEPTIQATAISGINSIELSIKVQNAGCAKNYTLGYRIKQFNDAEFGANQVIANATSENKVTTQIEGLVTGVEYIIEAYIVNGYNNNELFYAEPISCTVLASEICDVPSANYIEILANNDENLQLYAWVEGKGTTPLGGWPGKTRDTWYEVNSKGYSVWKIESSDPVYLIFNKGDNSKTDDIKGTDNEGFKPGYRYIFDVKNDWNFEVQDPTIIADPEVETVSATPVRLANGNSNVTIQGRVLKKGCADIREYGFRYKLIDADSYETVNVAEADVAVGEIFEKTIELPVGTYFIRARVVNANGSKAYGDEFRITIAERDLTIAAVHGDTSVDTETYYDFVGLYMSSITKPTNVEISSYTWYKDGNEYNPTFTASNLYGETYINTNGTNNIRPNETGVYKLEVELSNGTTLESDEIEVTEASAVSASSILTASNRTLPVISVRTNEDFPKCSSGSYPSAQADKLKKKRSVDVKIFDKDGKLYYDRKARMNYRGSSSLNFVKKSYAFCPGGDMCGDVEKGLDYVITEKVNMFNLGASDKDWVLYAAAADPSLMRNRIVFDTYAAMTNKWGVKSMFVELVVDGNYKGVYVFMDKITKNKNRVNITAADGFIVKFDKTDTADRYVDGKQEKGDEKTFMTEGTGIQDISTYGTTVDQMFEIEYPEKDDNKGTWNNIVASIKDKFEKFETALAEGNYSKVREIIDYDSWADWFIISEYIKNQDAYRASCIFVYNGEKIEARPLWDQELSMNNTSHTSHNCDDTNSLLITTASIYGDDFPAPFWFTGHDGASIEGGLLKDGCFISLVQKKLADYLKEGAALYAGEDAKDKRGPILKLAHDFNEELVSKTEGQTSAQEREDKFWDGKSRSSAECGGTHSYSQSSYSNEYGNVKNWILGDRDENLTSILDGMSGEMTSGISITTSPDNAIVTPWIPITVTVNVADDAEYIYDDSSITQGIELDVDKAITSKSGNKYTYTFPRPADWNVDNVETAIEQIVYPINAQLKVKDTTCPGVSNETQIRIRLRDEGNDICGELIEQ